MVSIHGVCDDRFRGLHDAFAQNFEVDDEVGAAVALELEGRLVVDLWAGHVDLDRRQEWQRDTLVNVFSIGKAATAVCLHHLVENGAVDLDAPVARYWPEFAAADKGAIPVHMLLSHRAGLPAVRRPLPDDVVYDWDAMIAALAAEAPWWEPGSGHGYHTNTFGFLVGEVIRRAAGTTAGRYLAENVAGPLGIEFHIGLDASLDHRVAPFLGYDGPFPPLADPGDDAERALMVKNAYANPRTLSGVGVVNTRRWRAAEMPSTNGHSNARSIARLMGELSRGTILRASTIARASAEAAAGHDLILDRPSRFGLGFQLTQPERPIGPNEGAFGHFGAGGSVGFADPDAHLGFAYTMGKMGPRWQNPKNRRLIDAVYQGL
jgi:CubicO group peptidase (beta-lactamase class C family)